jgi:DNA polymerase-3 subunit delta'
LKIAIKYVAVTKMFQKIFGHDLPKQMLSAAIKNGAVSHGYIFHGPAGVGKFAMAKEFAQILVCENGDACGECPSCRRLVAGTTPDFRVIDLSLNKDGEQKGSISVDDIREIASDIYMRPFVLDRKIYIRNNAGKMTAQAQNALLKAFEEPPRYAVIILVCDNISNILPTIQSRGAAIRFNPLPPGAVREYLSRAAPGASASAIENAALIANGSIERAASILGSENYDELRRETAENFLSLLFGKNKTGITKLYGTFIKYEGNFDLMLDIMSSMVYDIINGGRGPLIKNKDIKYPGGGKNLDARSCHEIFRTISGLAQRLSTNASYGLSVFAALAEIRERV